VIKMAVCFGNKIVVVVVVDKKKKKDSRIK
jgi:hypothetical protein